MNKGPFLLNRRQLFKTAAGAAAFLGLRRRAYAFYQSPGLQKFIQPLRTILNGGLVVAQPDGTVPVGGIGDHYNISIGEYTDTLHPSLPPTKLWGYFQRGANGAPIAQKHLGGIIVAKSGVPVQITFTNELPDLPIIPVDPTMFSPGENTAPCKTVVHLHGGLVPWVSDGGPFDWFLPNRPPHNGLTGPSFRNDVIANHGPGTAEYFYPNNQSARLVWYHDHAHGITRTNAYAGVASGYLITDTFEAGLIAQKLVPDLVSEFHIPLIFQDKVFVGDNIHATDPTWAGPTDKGSLWYPHTYEPPDLPNETLPLVPPYVTGRWDRSPSPFLPSGPGNPQALPVPTSGVAEMFGDTMLVNGTVYPHLDVKPRRYRFRVLNACNARFLNLQLYVKDATSPDGITLVPKAGELDPNLNPVLVPDPVKNPAGPAMYQIGTEGGFLPALVVLNNPPKPVGFLTTGPASTLGNVNRSNLLLGPAERADIVVDFSGFAGKTLFLYSDTPAPFPGGDIRNDYFFGMPDMSLIGGSAGPGAGFGPNTRTLLEITVAPTGPADTVPTANWITKMQTSLASRSAALAPPPQAGAVKRAITLNETFDEYGRLVQMVGTNIQVFPATPGSPAFFGQRFEERSTEVVNAGATEIWEIYNLTADTHPMHFHLVNVQILNRQAFDPFQFPSVAFLGPARVPDANERGWKETVRCNPGEVTRVIMKFDMPPVPFTVPSSTRIEVALGVGSSPTTKYHEYVYHCHILEHEEHDMMRPLVVKETVV